MKNNYISSSPLLQPPLPILSATPPNFLMILFPPKSLPGRSPFHQYPTLPEKRISSIFPMSLKQF